MWTTVDGLPHLLSTRSAAHLRSVAARFEPRWCTGWEERADEHLPTLLGLGPWGHLSFGRPERGASPRHWKLAAIDAAAGRRALAWVDDAFDASCWAWAAARGAPTLLVPTDPAEGVTAAHAARLAQFADRLAGAAPG